MRAAQLDMAEELWAAGYRRECERHPRVTCRHEPCTIAHGIRCCAECMGCVQPCPIAKGAGR